MAAPEFIGLLALAAVLAIVALMAWLMLRLIRDSQRDPTLCVNCGYDLRHSSERCPECGNLIVEEEEPKFVRLRDEWPAESMEPRPHEPTETEVVVFATENDLEANLLREQFMARGINARVAKRAKSSSQSGTEAAVVIWSGDNERAKAVIAALL